MNKILKYFLTLAFIVSVGIVASAQDAAKKKVAVYMTGTDINEAYKKVIGAKLVSAITESGEYAAVERTADFLAAISAENEYQTSGEVRDSQIAALGQKFGVQFVAVADVSEVFNEFFIAARMINVETGLVEKAFDTNGPAENMSQLVSLSKNIANGLLKKAPIQPKIPEGSYTPLNLSLCVTDNKGRTKYFTKDQWIALPSSEKNRLKKLGICLISGGDSFIVKLYEPTEHGGNWYWAQRKGAPSLTRLKIIYRYRDSINGAIKVFGGRELPDIGPYWSNESYNSSEAWYCSFGHGDYVHIDKSQNGYVRPVIEIP